MTVIGNQKYDEGRAAIAKNNLDLDTVVTDLVAIDTGYVFDAAHDSTDLSGFILDTAATLGGNAVDGQGYFTTNPAVFTSLGIGDDPIAFVLMQQGGLLLEYIDTLDGSIPVDGEITGDGTDLTINPPTVGWIRV